MRSLQAAAGLPSAEGASFSASSVSRPRHSGSAARPCIISRSPPMAGCSRSIRAIWSVMRPTPERLPSRLSAPSRIPSFAPSIRFRCRRGRLL